MASHLLRLPLPLQFPPPGHYYPSPPPLPKPLLHIISPQSRYSTTTLQKPTLRTSPIVRSLSTTQSATPPSSREEAVLQARTCLYSTLQKPLNNPVLLPRQKLKKQRQPRYRVEIPVVNDSPASLSQLAFEVFSDLPVTVKGSNPNILGVWPDAASLESARQVLQESSTRASRSLKNSDLASAAAGALKSVDMAVFMSPKASALDEIRRVCDDLYPKPVVLFNPRWAFEEEGDFDGESRSFVDSFDVVYSFLGLEVQGILSRRRGVVLRSVRDGVFSGEGWLVFVEDEENKGEMRVVSRFKKRPAIGDVESVLYNLMAANSPVTKSVKFLRDLASNVLGKKGK